MERTSKVRFGWGMVVYDTRPSDDICVPGFLFNPGLGGGNGRVWDQAF